ncbi:PEP/pyruvate-binding domain-containing protein, partial [Endozoicomonas sp. ONNA2]|uniref:PEP/pyruvate-binding domain-containing protein n=1 Tax=Endozoicomonas sp. ONNA2 TaxID=2828741 RepID=UPI0021475D28
SAREIRQRYLACQQQSHCQRCIVRSSGVDEDRFGDAQAGRYQSIVHHDGDILATCLQVLASAYHPDACPQGKVSAMALIIQQYIQCQAGGVLSSHLSLSDDRIEVEYVRSQPDEAVSGTSASPVLRCTIRRDTTEDVSADKKYHFLRDSSDQNTAMGIDDALLSADVLQCLQEYTVELENRFCCPVDIEFGIRSINSQQQPILLQVRPVTCLPGSNHYTDNAPESSLVIGTIVSEGCCSGVAVRACATTPCPAEALSPGAILFADYAGDWMLAPDILQRLGGLVFRLGTINGHVAIALRQAGKPCLLAGEQFSTAVDAASGQQVTVLVGSFAGEPGAYLLKGDHSAHWQAVSNTLNQDSIDSCALAHTTRPAEPLDCTGVDQALSWLNSQNDKLLGYFHPDRLLNRCLAPGRSTSISMSANRARLLSLLDSEIIALMHDLELFFGGYQHFLALAQDTGIDTGIDTDFDIDSDIYPDPKTALTLLKRELSTLGEQCLRLQTSVRKLREKIVPPPGNGPGAARTTAQFQAMAAGLPKPAGYSAKTDPTA